VVDIFVFGFVFDLSLGVLPFDVTNKSDDLFLHKTNLQTIAFYL